MTSKPDGSAAVRRWGAAASEWAHFKKLAKADLLPVVSDPTAELSPRTKMKAVGKTPSLFNQDGLAIGFTNWTEHETTVLNIETWSEVPQLGICVQTRRFRAFDIDVPNQALSDEIKARAWELLGIDGAPTRTRPNSGNQLFIVYAEGELSKDAFPVKEYQDADGKTKRWLVELLATGQQFIAAGTHTSGVPYEWLDGLPKRADVPVVSIKRILAAMATLKDEYAVATWKAQARHAPTLLEDLNIDDPVAEHLIEQGLVLGEGKNQVFVECPWIDGHSSENGETETSWMIAGTGKYRNGHFSCRHAGCSHRTDAEFKAAVGYKPAKASEFEDLRKDDAALAAYVALAPGASPKSKELKAAKKFDLDKPLPAFDRDGKDQIETNLKNLVAALRAPQAVECELAYDEFRGELMYAEQPGEWQALTDGFQTELSIRIEDLGFKDQVDITKLRRALDWISDHQRMDTAIYWLENLVPAWDGVPRIHRFWPDYMRTKDTEYTQQLGLYSWTAHAARILDPGCQVDMVPVLVGDEGLRKTSALKAIIPHPSHYGEFNLAKDDEKLARIMRGKLLGELAELRGISVRDAESVLAWITRTEEEWTPKFKEFNTTLARRLVLYGTTNDLEFLQPHMGFRRWLPVMILGLIDTNKITRDCIQLWAEARETYISEGIEYAAVERLAKAERAAFKHIDPWFDKVNAAIDDTIGEDDDDNELTMRNCGTLTGERVLIDVLGFDAGRIKKAEQMRIGEVLKACGMVKIQRKVAGRNMKVWVSTSSDLVVDTGDRRTRAGRS